MQSFIDPHFHYWDIRKESKTGHNPTYLGGIGERYPLYTPTQYLAHMKQTGKLLKKAVFIEAISDDPLAEVKWVNEISISPAAEGVIHRIVAYAPLHQSGVENLLREYANFPSVVGIRQILNHHPKNSNLTWPKVTEDFLSNSTWRDNYPLLQKYNLSFDLQLNPHQFSPAAAFIAKYPGIPVIINHLGTLFLGGTEEENNAIIITWRDGMRALSSLPHVTIKISMLMFTSSGWETDAEKRKIVAPYVKEVIQLFGTKRCMFGSNFPVDDLSAPPSALYSAFDGLVEHLTNEERHDLFYGTADRVYKLSSAKF